MERCRSFVIPLVYRQDPIRRERKMGMDKELGKRIRAARCYGRLSHIELARRLGLSVGSLIAYEKGRSPVPEPIQADLAARVVEITGIDEDFLMRVVDRV